MSTSIELPPSGGGIPGVTVSGTPTTGQVLTATSGSAANWSTPSGTTPDATSLVKGVVQLANCFGGTAALPTVTNLVMGSDAQGDVIYRGSSAYVRLGAGTSGQAFLTGGASANPSWGTNFGANALVSTSTLSIGTTPSAALGVIRVPGGATTQMAYRNNANSVDLALLATDTSNGLSIGDATNGGTTSIQAPSTVNLKAGAVTIAQTTSGGLSIFAGGAFFASTFAPAITHVARPSDLATQALTITSQAPFASAVTNLVPGNIVLTVPSPVGAGAAGKIQHSISGTVQGSFISGGLELGTNPAASQTLRLPNGNTGGISSRNAANTGDFIAYKIDGTNAQYFGDSTNVGTVIQSGASGIYLRPSGTTAFSITAASAIFVSPIVQIGTTPSLTGNLALPASFTINQRNAANSTDNSVIKADASDNITFGSSLSGTTQVVGNGNVILTIASTGRFTLSASTAIYSVPTVQYASSAGAVTFNQATTAVNSATGSTLLVQAQSASGTTSVGGDLQLSAGTGTSSNGFLNLLNLPTTTTAPSAGAGSALPATPAGYLTIKVGGTSRQIAYY